MQTAAREFQARFGIAFGTVMHFSKSALHALHAADGDDHAVLRRAQIASETDDEIVQAMATLREIANQPVQTAAGRRRYFSALQHVYRRLLVRIPDEDRVVIAPEREGRILAESLGVLRAGIDLAPHAKRIPFNGGLLVGVSACRLQRRARRLLLFDGAIASGATLITLLELVGRPDTPIAICSVHAAREGMRAIHRYAVQSQLQIDIFVGHVTEGLSSKYYAVGASHELIVGDLGDTIAPLTDAWEQ